jgi:glycosyltransferase involved in cell wall biosynthesis
VLAFVEARGVTGALRNLLDVVSFAEAVTPRISLEVATYWRSRVPGRRAAASDDIQLAIDACRERLLPVHVLQERYAGDPRLLGQVRALIAARRPDVIETHHVKSHFLVAVSGASRGNRWLALHHGYTATSRRTRACNRLDRWSLRRASAVLTPCAAFAGQLRGVVPAARLTVLHNAVAPFQADARDVAEFRRQHAIDPGARVVLTAGRLSREKAQAHLIAAFAREPLRSMPDAVLVIAGDGPDRRTLEALARRLGVMPRVRFTGQLTNVWPAYFAAHAFALPSDSEGSPNALLEAMAAALPAVATRVGGIPEIITHEVTGVLVPPRDPAALSYALGSVLADADRAASLGARAQALVRQRFSPHARAAALAGVYAGVCRA